MPFNNFYRTLFAILLTVFIFATIVVVLCIIRRRERRREEREDATRARVAEQRRAFEERTRTEAERRAAIIPDHPPPYQIDLPIWDPTGDMNAPGETPVSPPVSAVQFQHKMAESADKKIATSSTCIRSISYSPTSTLIQEG